MLKAVRLVLALLLAFALVGCGGSNAPTSPEQVGEITDEQLEKMEKDDQQIQDEEQAPSM